MIVGEKDLVGPHAYLAEQEGGWEVAPGAVAECNKDSITDDFDTSYWLVHRFPFTGRTPERRPWTNFLVPS